MSDVFIGLSTCRIYLVDGLPRHGVKPHQWAKLLKVPDTGKTESTKKLLPMLEEVRQDGLGKLLAGWALAADEVEESVAVLQFLEMTLEDGETILQAGIFAEGIGLPGEVGLAEEVDVGGFLVEPGLDFGGNLPEGDVCPDEVVEDAGVVDAGGSGWGDVAKLPFAVEAGDI